MVTRYRLDMVSETFYAEKLVPDEQATEANGWVSLADHLAAMQALEREVKYLTSSINGNGGYKECLSGEKYLTSSLTNKITAMEQRNQWLDGGKQLLEQFLRQSVSPMEWKVAVKDWLAREPGKDRP